jgi:hypothetical protein
MIKHIKDALAQRKTFKIISVEDVPGSWNAVVPSGVGGGGAWDYVRQRAQKQNLAVVQDPMVLAVDVTSRILFPSPSGPIFRRPSQIPLGL